MSYKSPLELYAAIAPILTKNYHGLWLELVQRQVRRLRSESKKKKFGQLLKKFKKKIKRAKIKGERSVKSEGQCVVEAAVTFYVFDYT